MSTYDVKAGLATIDQFSVIGVSTITSNEDGKATEDINALWERFFELQTGQIVTAKYDDIIYAVYSDYEGDHNKPYRITIGYRVPDDTPVPTPHKNDLFKVQVNQGDYGVMSAQGQQPKALIETWEAIWSSDLNRLFKTDFEIYGPRFFEDGIHEVLIHIGLKMNDAI